MSHSPAPVHPPKTLRRTKRADTLPLFTITTLELPEDPKIWSLAHQSAYLSLLHTPRGWGRGVPDQVTRDITAFVKDNGEDVLEVKRG